MLHGIDSATTFYLGQFTVLMVFKLVITARFVEVDETEKVETCIALDLAVSFLVSMQISFCTISYIPVGYNAVLEVDT